MSMAINDNATPNKAVMLGIGLLLPALISLGHSLASSSTLPGVTGTARPGLAFDQYMVDLHEPLVQRPIHEAQFHFENRGSRPVKITGIKPSCGCLTPKIVSFDRQRKAIEQKEFAPGEHGVLAMGIRPAKETPGEKSYTVAVSYDDGQPRTEVLEFRITLPKKKLTVEPNELYFYQVSGEADTRTVTITDFREHPAQVTEVVAVSGGSKDDVQPLEGVVASLGASIQGPDGELMWPVQVSVAPNLPAGRHSGFLVIKTTDPDSSTVKVPILLYGQEQSTAGKTAPKQQYYGPQRQAAADQPDLLK